jgi:hypothetical protein
MFLIDDVIASANKHAIQRAHCHNFSVTRAIHAYRYDNTEHNISLLEVDDSWHAEGLKLDLVDPMKRWTVRYEGDVVHQATGKVHKLKLDVSDWLPLTRRP